MALLVVAALAWANRRTLARDALTGWLKARGVPAAVDVREVGPGRFQAQLALGDPARPDFTAQDADIRYHLSAAGLQVDTVILRAPVLRASIRGGRPSAGSLDPVIREFLSRPAPATSPAIRLERARLLLETDYGPLDLTADARIDDNRITSLTATTAPAHLTGPAFDVRLGPANVGAATDRSGRLTASLTAPVVEAKGAGAAVSDGRVTARFAAAWPDFGKSRGLGAFTLDASAQAASGAYGARTLGRPALSLAVTGDARGWNRDLSLSGGAELRLTAESARAPEGRTGGLTATLTTANLRWTPAKASFAADLTGEAAVSAAAAAALRFDTLTLAIKGQTAGAGDAVRVNLTARAACHGRWAGLGPAGAQDQGQIVALKRAARGFALAADSVTLSATTGPAPAFSVRLARPVTLRPDSGGEVRLAQVTRDVFRLTAGGGGLPETDVSIRPLATGAGLLADISGHARVSAGAAVGADLDAAGRLSMGDGGIRFAAARCAALKIDRLEFGANDVEQLATRLCPAGGPMVALSGGDWRFAARMEDAAAAVPFQQVKLTQAAGPVFAASRRGRMTAQVTLETARVEDTSPQPRLYALAASGRAALADYVWTADFALRQPRGPQLLAARLKHDSGLGVGFLTLDTGDLRFAEGGLQPAELSPAARAIGSPATGVARFTGRFDWAAVGAGSEGTLTLKDLTFASPAGRVEGLNGALKFTSLAPLTAAPGQALDVDTVLAIVPLTNLHASFGLADNLFRIAGGEALVGGGRIRIESLEAPLTPGPPVRGVLAFEGVQLHDLVEATPFADKVELDARVSGRIAFEARDGKVRIEDGELKAIQPGRLSIDRTALTGVQANGAAPAAPGTAPGAPDPNVTFTDFAYQAMENLAFDTLTATVATRKDGRLGVLFHMIGRHDPPQKQRIRLTVMDLISKRFLGRALPLPSGTKVDLTLDTSLNLDDLLADYADFRKLHGSGQVQP